MKNEPHILFHSEENLFELKSSNKVAEVLIDFVNQEYKQCGIVNYVFCDDEYLLKLNIDYLNHDYYTDILSFQMDDDPIQGDIFISIVRVEENAQKLNVPFEIELFRVISHGLLHFLGYKDKTDDEIKLMRSKEDELIEKLKIYV